jgi:Ca2+-binding EF-hand superfamily protein
VDGDGQITSDKLRDTLIRLKSKTDVEKLMRAFNTEGKCVTLEEFRDAWIKKDLAQTNEDFQLDKICGTSKSPKKRLDKTLIRDLRRAFDGIDTKHTGRINFEHLEQLFIQAGERVESARLRELVRFFSSTYEEAEKGITFDDFCDGIAKRDVLLKHPLGKKLAQITLLEHVLRSQELSRCMDRGIVVRGERQLIVDKIVFDTSTKFTLVSTKQDTHGIDCVYTFRFCGGGHQSSVSPSASSRQCRRR